MQENLNFKVCVELADLIYTVRVLKLILPAKYASSAEYIILIVLCIARIQIIISETRTEKEEGDRELKLRTPPPFERR